MSLFKGSYEMENSWVPTGNTQRLTPAQLKSVKQAVVREKELEDGNVIRNIVLFINGGKPESIKLSPYNEPYPNGTRINPASIVYSEYVNDSGETTWTAMADKA